MLRSSKPSQAAVSAAEGRQRRHHHREQREARDGLDHAREAEHRPFEAAPARHGDAERNAGQRGEAERHQRELEMGGQVAGQQRELLAHGAPPGARSSASTAAVQRRGAAISSAT